MSWVAAAVVGGSVLGGAVSAIGSTSAANTQASAQENAAAQQMQMFNTINSQEQPFITAGQGATTTLQQLLGLTSGSPGNGLANGYLTQTTPSFSFDPSSITSSPGYQFAQKQGLSAVANNEAPNVGALSGAAMKALTSFSTGTAEQYYNDYYNQAANTYNTNLNAQQTQQNNIFNRLSSIAGLGQNAASQTGNAGAQLGSNAAAATAAAGASSAAGTVGASNAISGGISSAANGYALSSILNNNTSSSYGVPGWTPATGGT